MDYEKKYKEALGWMQSVYPTMTGSVKEDAEHYFPELRESEDEKVRKEIIKLIRFFYGSSLICEHLVSEDSMIAWLEKQKSEEINVKALLTADRLAAAEMTGRLKERKDIVENPQKYGLEKQGEQENKVNSYKITFEDVLALECAMKTVKITKGGNELYEMLDLLYNKIHNAYLLEKQGTSYTKRDVDDAHVEGMAFAKKELEKQGQKPADKIEQKFKVGEWITCEGLNTAKIVNIDGDRYEVEFVYGNGNKGFPHIDYIDRFFHLWSIKDAKNGDVLATDDWVFIFEKLNTDGKPICYCHYDIELGFVIDVNTYISTGSYIRPATKEERDLLFQKMYEAGYTFDFESKELKKIEQKPIFDVEIPFGAKDSELQEATYLIPEGFHTEIKGDKVVIKKGKQKPAWTEADDEELENTINALKGAGKHGSFDWLSTVKWLLTIKQRIRG